jgi:hypothetical protein
MLPGEEGEEIVEVEMEEIEVLFLMICQHF